MDNAGGAWELPPDMGSPAWLPMLVSFCVAVAFAPAGGAASNEAARLVNEAKAALDRDPPDLEAARLTLGRAISAGGDAEAVAQAHYLRGRVEEDAGAYEAALDDDRAALETAPNTRWGQRASDRADWLGARAEGGFEPLRRLERVRRDPAQASDAATVASLAHDAESFPPGVVRTEARMFVAEAWLGRLHRAGDGIAELRKVADDPNVEPSTTRLAERELVDALASEGRSDEAAAEARAHASRLDPEFATRIGRLARRWRVRLGAYGVLATFAALVAAALARVARRGGLLDAWTAARRLLPLSVGFAAFLALGGGALASSYERGNAAPFYWLAASAWPLVLLARAWGAVGSPGKVALAVRLAVSGASVFAAAFVLLDGLYPSYLDGFGL